VKIKGYPEVLPERETLEAILSGRSIARYGDGELRVALGRKCVSQEADPKLAKELRAILADEQNGLLVGIPNIASKTPKAESWSTVLRSRLHDDVQADLLRIELHHASG
jgi:hypothetical protein